MRAQKRRAGEVRETSSALAGGRTFGTRFRGLTAARLTVGWLGQAAESAPVRLKAGTHLPDGCWRPSRCVTHPLAIGPSHRPTLLPSRCKSTRRASHGESVRKTFSCLKTPRNIREAAFFRSGHAKRDGPKSLVNPSLLACTSGLNVPLLWRTVASMLA